MADNRHRPEYKTERQTAQKQDGTNDDGAVLRDLNKDQDERASSDPDSEKQDKAENTDSDGSELKDLNGRRV